MEPMGHVNMPAFDTFKYKQISRLVRDREIGSSKNYFQSMYKSSKNNAQSDFDFIRSMLCDKEAYLETIACRKIPRSKSPAFCHGRLFTDNYQTWFNLFTGPASGPLLMTSDLFNLNDLNGQTNTLHEASQVKVVDATCIIRPNNCKLSTKTKWVSSRIVLLTKSGWLYEADVENCDIISKTYIPTKEYASNLCGIHSSKNKLCPTENEPLPSYSYRYLSCNKETESIVLKSSKVYHAKSETSSFAFCLFLLYPLRLFCHFILTVKSPNQTPPVTPDITDDLLILNVSRASNIHIYCLHDVIAEHDLGCCLSLHQKVKVRTPHGLSPSRVAEVGDESLGIPYTMQNVSLSANSVDFKSACLFKTAAMRHCILMGGCPYHYLIPVNKAGTIWTVKHFSDNNEVLGGRLKIEQKWDSSHWCSIRFLCEHFDGRIIKHGATSIEIYSIEHDLRLCDDSVPIAERELCDVNPTKPKCKINLDFIIDLQPVPRSSYSSTPLPLLAPHTITSRGRAVRRPPSWSVERTSADADCHLLASVDFDAELKIFIVVHYLPTGKFSSGWEKEEGRSDLVVSIFDCFKGKHMRTFVLDSDTSPYDRENVGVTIDHDTLIYTRMRVNDDRIQYKILRLNRKYGGG